MLSTMMQTHTNNSFNTYMQHLSNHSVQGVSSYGLTPSVYGITNPSQMMHVMILLKQLAFQNGTQYALKISVIITGFAFVAILFIGKKQEHVVVDKGQSIMAE